MKKTDTKKPNVADTIAITRILVSGTVVESEIPAKGERAAMTRYSQEAILTAGEAARPLTYEHTSFDKDKTLAEGVYILPAASFALTNYGALQLDRYLELIRIGDMNAEQKAMFARKAATMDDIL